MPKFLRARAPQDDNETRKIRRLAGARHAPADYITKLKGPWRGIWFDLYVMLDIFSRKAIWQEVHATENADLASEFITNAIAANGGTAPGGIHTDNGTSMTSKTVAGLLADLKISRSHSRPRVSNDNPYSEAQFKTLAAFNIGRLQQDSGR